MFDLSYRYAGLGRVKEPGLSVADAVERLRRLAYVERRLMRLLASRIVTVPERDIKVLLGRLQYEDARHADSLRNRVLELRTNKSKLENVPDPELDTLFNEAEYLPGTYPFLAGIVRVLKPALHAAYEAYLQTTNGLADYNSVRMIHQIMADEVEHDRLLADALSALSVVDEERAAAESWEEKLKTWLGAAGGADGTAARGPQPRREEPFHLYRIPHTLKRDASVNRVWDYVAPPLERVPEHLDYMMGLRLSEINVAEGLAIVLFETEDMPWSFYLDISRHLWDEIRHSLYGEAAVEHTYGDRAAIPMRDYEAIFALEAQPLEQYAVLGLEVEGKNMRYPPGKRQEWEFARDSACHPLMATLQDFDWADEVLHVNIARRQLDAWFEGGLKAIAEFSKRGRAHRTEVKQRHAPSVIEHPQ